MSNEIAKYTIKFNKAYVKPTKEEGFIDISFLNLPPPLDINYFNYFY